MSQYDGHMISRRRWQILALIAMALIGIGLGVWLLRTGFVALSCLYIGVFLWRMQQFVVWFIFPVKAPSDRTLPMTSRWERLLLSVVCLLGAAVCAVGVYLWRLWPDEWQAGLVFVLFGSLVLAPVTIKEIHSRKKDSAQAQAPTTV
jgi:hypothetical protein